MSNITTDQIFELLVQARRGRVTRDNLQKFLLNPDGEKEEAMKTFTVTVDYGKPISKMIAAGHYDWKNDDIKANNFPMSGTGEVTVSLELVYLRKKAKTKEVFAHMEAKGLRPANIAELLSFGATYPEIQREFSVICLGSVWSSSHMTDALPCLDGDSEGRGLRLFNDGGFWGDRCRFLAVRK